MKVVMYVGGNAPTRDSELTVGGDFHHFTAYYAPGYDVCGDPDCECRERIITGSGTTEAEAIADYWAEWEERYG